MSDDPQNWQEAPMPRRKGPPKWMIFVGCGCLIPGFILVVTIAWGLQHYAEVTSPRQAYDSLAATLPFDEVLMGRPTGLADDPSTRVVESHEEPEFELLFGAEITLFGGLAMYCFVRGAPEVDGERVFADDALVAIIAKIPTDQTEDAMRSRSDDDEGEQFQIEVQGVTLSGLRQKTMKSSISSSLPFGKTKVSGPGVSLKLRSDVARDANDPESKLFDVLLMLQRAKEGGAPITDEEIQRFLAPFHVGPAR